MRYFYSLLTILSLLFFSINLFAQLQIEVNSIPANTPMSDPIYVAGNFNNWNEKDDNFQLTKNNDGTYSISFNPSPGQLEFKFTRGSWTSVEGNSQGGFLPNRTYNYSGGNAQLTLSIASWEDLGSGSGQTSASDNVFLLDDNFNMPQLNRNRKIWIYLPPDYDNSGKNYPVIYMQDGQNLFDRYTSFSGEWEVDESLNRLFDEGDQGAIIIGIENGGADRINEYSPWTHPTYGGGQGAAYIDFIVNTLKPFVDENYRTLPDRNHTGIGGSSMGGLISMFAAIEHQHVFGKALVFSPSFWFSSEVYDHVRNTGKQENMRIYMLAGEQEDNGSVVTAIQNMKNTLIASGFEDSEIVTATHYDGQHSEWYWKREFPWAYRWLCEQRTTSISFSTTPSNTKLFPNPSDSILTIELQKEIKGGYYQILDLNGLVYLDRPLQGLKQYVATEYLASGVYVINIYEQNKLKESKKLVVVH